MNKKKSPPFDELFHSFLLFHSPDDRIPVFLGCRSSMKIRSQTDSRFQYLIHCPSDLCCAITLP